MKISPSRAAGVSDSINFFFLLLKMHHAKQINFSTMEKNM